MTARIKCAIYTRKSSEEGLEQSFNSLDAQREACDAYIRSQKHEGWIGLSARYDDGGFSGGNMDRPALKKLMDDIAGGKVNTVVVYKVDRLTRSLADFAKLVEQFDSKGVTFVSVTQQFNTTTSMGRLTLNVLLSFAQFEREVTGERIRDKIAASKAKGMWMGGPVPLGYDLRDRRLYINAAEAKQVREVFRQYLRLRNVQALMSYLGQTKILSKVRINANGNTSGGKHYSRGALYGLLRNHLYVGEIEHKGSIYPGEHESILDRQLWNQVQELLDQNRRGDRIKGRKCSGSLLTGLLFDESGTRYTPTGAQKGARRYHYYTSQSLIRGEKTNGSIGRLPAPALEGAVVERIRMFLDSSSETLDAMKLLSSTEKNYERLLKQAKVIASRWKLTTQAEKAELTRTMLHRVIVHDSALEILLDLEATLQILSGKVVEGQASPKKVENIQTVSLQVPFRNRNAKIVKLVFGNDRSDPSGSREAIAKAIARARSWCDLIVQGRATGLLDLASQHGLTHRYVKNIFPLAFLGPESVEALLNDSPPRTLHSLLGKVPVRWDMQREFIENE